MNIFDKMTSLARQNNALNLSQGFPGFNGPEELIQFASARIKEGFNQYAPTGGILELKHAISKQLKLVHDTDINAESEITVTSGASAALYCAFAAYIRPGDEVIILDPSYDTYEPTIALFGGIPRRVPMSSDYSIDWQRIEDTLNSKTSVLVLNSPHNPTGYALTATDLEALHRLVEKHDFLIISDEVYEHILFDQRTHLSVCRYPELFSRSFVVSSFGKSFHMTGWKVGYCVAPEKLTDKARKIHQLVNFCTNTPAQYAYADFLTKYPSYPQSLPNFFEQKRDLLCGLLADSRFTYKPAAGTYFQLIDYSAISDLPDTEYAELLIKEHKIATIPLSVFTSSNTKKVVRLCFAKDEDVLRQAAQRLCDV